MRMASPAVIVLVIIAAEAVAVERPAIVVRANALGITIPAEILRRADVRRHLTNGLTTAMVVAAKPLVRGGERSGARVEVRYDPWDEVFFVTHRDFDGTVERAKIASMAALETWLVGRPLRFAVLSAASRWDVELRILPFSAAEEADVRAWVSGTTPPPPGAAEGGADGGGSSLFDLLVGTSIRARPVVAYRWTLDAPSRR